MKKPGFSGRFWAAPVIFSLVGQVLIPGMVGPAIGSRLLRDAATVVGDDGTAAFIPDQTIFSGALVALLVLLPLLFIFKKERSHD